VGERATSVEVVAKAVVSALSMAPDWPTLLFGEIEEALVARRIGK
jgi:hypothetical protein